MKLAGNGYVLEQELTEIVWVNSPDGLRCYGSMGEKEWRVYHKFDYNGDNYELAEAEFIIQHKVRWKRFVAAIKRIHNIEIKESWGE